MPFRNPQVPSRLRRGHYNFQGFPQFPRRTNFQGMPLYGGGAGYSLPGEGALGFGAGYGGGRRTGAGLAQQYQNALDEANRANEQRYQDTIGELQSVRSRAMGRFAGYGEQAADDIRERYNDLSASDYQGLVSRGLGNSSLRHSFALGRQRELTRDLNRLNESIIGQQNAADIGTTNSLAQMMASRVDQQPDLGQMAALYGNLGASGYGQPAYQGVGGGGYGYGMPMMSPQLMGLYGYGRGGRNSMAGARGPNPFVVARRAQELRDRQNRRNQSNANRGAFAVDDNADFSFLQELSPVPISNSSGPSPFAGLPPAVDTTQSQIPRNWSLPGVVNGDIFAAANYPQSIPQLPYAGPTLWDSFNVGTAPRGRRRYSTTFNTSPSHRAQAMWRTSQNPLWSGG